jgi:UDP-N-acetylglucosamine--N-acetylmuramyl-(pentapeptide) pyrophosphoryl-undecaprenol N-acetylglucosamine transferase
MKILFAGGGTGGHLFPGIALAQAFKKHDPAIRIVFGGTTHGLEKDLVPHAGFSVALMNVRSLKGKGSLRKLFSLLSLPGSFIYSVRLLSSFNPDLIVGVGGYASGPLVLAGALMGKWSVLLEQNAIPGATNRFLARFAKKIFLPTEEALAYVPKAKAIVTGNPLRAEILEIPPVKELQNGERLTILIFGGSQGAHKLNAVVTEALPLLTHEKDQLFFIHQTGYAQKEKVESLYQESGFQADVRPFFDNMAEAYSKAHLVIGRSGSSVFEIAACGRPSILVPYPFSADNHQVANGELVKNAGAALLYSNDEVTGEKIATEIKKFLHEPDHLSKMAAAARAFAKRDATDHVLRSCLELIGEKNG